jgi:hypothetical protein
MRVRIYTENRLIAAAARGLAAGIAGWQVVKGATNAILKEKGYVTFDFAKEEQARAFQETWKELVKVEFASC